MAPAQTYNRFRALGAFVYTAQNLTDQQLQAFSNIGGKWFCPVIYGDDAAGPWNRANLPSLKQRAQRFNLEVAAWANVTASKPNQQYATEIAKLVKQYQLPLLILDAELAYQYPSPGCQALPELLLLLRTNLPATDLLLSSLGPNNAYIYNGRTLTPPKSMYDLGWRHAPQWYSSYYNKDGKSPQDRMSWLKANAHTDFNIKDDTAPSKRGLPLSYVHPTTEATGLEGSNLAEELRDIKASQIYGMTAGISYYTLENGPPSDMPLLAKYRNVLYV